jgi:uncharacterized protein DUF7019
MEYFEFVSDRKVDMLLPQIPQETKSKLAAEFGINIGVLTAKLRSERDTGVESDRISRLNAVAKYLRDTEDIGTVDEPKSWIAGTQDVRVAFPADHRQAVFFVGRSQNQARFALAGSSAHLISRGKANAIDIGWSFLPDLMMQLESMISLFEKQRIEDASGDRVFRVVTQRLEREWIKLVTALERQTRGPSMKVSFLAKSLKMGRNSERGFNAVLATPLYVAMA